MRIGSSGGLGSIMQDSVSGGCRNLVTEDRANSHGACLQYRRKWDGLVRLVGNVMAYNHMEAPPSMQAAESRALEAR